MKKIILFSLLALTACKKETPTPIFPIPTTKYYYIDVEGLSTNPNASQILFVKGGSIGIDSIYNTKRDSIKITKNDTLIIKDNDYTPHHIKVYKDKALEIDTARSNQLFELKYYIK